jgi:hypothetical protein
MGLGMVGRCAVALVCLAVVMDFGPDSRAEEPATAPPASPSAETGTVVGTVLDKTTGDPLIQAGVEVVGQPKHYETDMDGHFTLKLPPGTYEFRVSMPLYQPVRLQGVKVKANEVTKQSVSLATAPANVEVVEVTAKANKAAEAVQLVERKKSAVVSETISAETIKKSPDKDVAAIVKRVPAVTIKDDRFVFVRGLGERYSSALLNESRLPSTDPDKRVVPLDLFPAEFVQSLSVIKTYTPDLPGDFSGGLIDIHLFDSPEQFSFLYGQSFSGNTKTTFQPFQTYKGGALDYFGFGNSTRALPTAVAAIPAGMFNTLPENERDALGRQFENIWSQQLVSAPMNLGLNFATGDKIGNFGFALGGNFRTDYQTIGNRIENIYKNGGAANPVQIIDRFIRNDGVFTARLGGVFTAGYRINDSNKLFLRSFVDRSSFDDTQFAFGVDSNIGALKQTILQWTEEQLGFGQVGGEHHWQGFWLDWRTALAQTTQTQPDTRYTAYSAPAPLGPSGPFPNFQMPFQFTNNSLGGNRTFGDLSEYLTDSAVDFTIPFLTKLPFTDVWSGLPAKFKFGPAYSYRHRDFDLRQFEASLENPGALNLFAPPEVILAPSHIIPGIIDFQELTGQGFSFSVSQEIIAGYGMVDLPIVRDKLRFIGGVRLEYSDIELHTTVIGGTAPVTISKINTDPLPGANLVYSPRYDMNVRFGFSKSVSRPEFRELSPTQYPAPRGLLPLVGNQALVESHITNWDARWEWFFSPLELVSLSFFHKSIDQPIEQTVVNFSSYQAYSFANAESATLTGFEFEGRKDFGFISNSLRNLSLTANVAYIKSNVITPPAAPTQQPLESNRPLQGQAPYIANATLEYVDPYLGGTYRLLYQTAGETLVAAAFAGENALPAINQTPRNQLDLIAILPVNWFGTPLTLKLGAENLLDEPYVRTQANKTQQYYKRGIKASLALTYSY